MRILPVLFAVVVVFGTSIGTVAQTPDSVSFQGYITDLGGTPINDASASITFTLYEGSTAVWSEVQSSIVIVDGIFNVLLGSVTPLDTVRFNRPLLLGIKVGADPEILPRVPIAATAYAKALPGFYTFYHENGYNKSYNVIGGAENNVVGADVTGATISGGGGFTDSGNPVPNSVLDDYATVGGGRANLAGEDFATVGGGDTNNNTGIEGTIGGGNQNTVSAEWGTVGGGSNNAVTAQGATIGGGYDNRASNLRTTIGGGYQNEATGLQSTVPGGVYNSARGDFSFAAGNSAKANHDGTFVWNDYLPLTGDNDSLESTGPNQFLIRATGGVGIGTNSPRAMLTIRGPNNPHTGPVLHLTGNVADQVESGRIRFVEGTNTSNYRGAYIRYDGSNGVGGNALHIGVHNNSDSLRANDLDVITIQRGSGEVGIQRTSPLHPLQVGTTTSNGAGAYLSVDGMWTNASSRTFKTNFEGFDKVGLLNKLQSLPIKRWSYKGHEDERHIGPFAEDFFETFGLGSDDKYIGGPDASGVALAAIQGLYELVREQQAEIERLKSEVASLR